MVFTETGDISLQGVICFESLMEEGRKRGIVEDNKPIICKPNKVVSASFS